jgi:hypothetical protein
MILELYVVKNLLWPFEGNLFCLMRCIYNGRSWNKPKKENTQIVPQSKKGEDDCGSRRSV